MEQFRSVEDYIVVREKDDRKFEKSMAEYIDKGYVPAGAPLISQTIAATSESGPEFLFFQVMLKYSPAVAKI